MPLKEAVLSLFDHSGNAVRPWAEAGYTCFCLDILHPAVPHTEKIGSGLITYIRADLNEGSYGWEIAEQIILTNNVVVLLSWPPCEDMARTGNRHLAKKREADPDFQRKAAQRAVMSSELGDRHQIPWMVENPIGALSRLWRKPDYIWHPHQFGGLLPMEDEHPEHPKYIAPRDAYTKYTGAWTGCGFNFPEVTQHTNIEPEVIEKITKAGNILRGSRQYMYLGGDYPKTKKIRNLTPRGFALAVFLANSSYTVIEGTQQN